MSGLDRSSPTNCLYSKHTTEPSSKKSNQGRNLNRMHLTHTLNNIDTLVEQTYRQQYQTPACALPSMSSKESVQTETRGSKYNSPKK